MLAVDTWLRSTQSDWKDDSRGEHGLTFKMFHMSLFQLADMWCDDIDAAEYTAFLETLLNAIAVESDDGELEFRRIKGTPCCAHGGADFRARF